jgi:hypothetical protein
MGISSLIALGSAYSGYQSGNLARKETRGALRASQRAEEKAATEAALATNADKARRKRNRSSMLMETGGGSATSAMSAPVTSYGKTTTGQ